MRSIPILRLLVGDQIAGVRWGIEEGRVTKATILDRRIGPDAPSSRAFMVKILSSRKSGAVFISGQSFKSSGASTSIEVVSDFSFSGCKSDQSIPFEDHSSLQQIERHAFRFTINPSASISSEIGQRSVFWCKGIQISPV
jgi:hypothetical protein